MAAKSLVITDFRTQIPGQLSEDGLTWEFPNVKSTNSHSKETYWRIYVKVLDGSGNPVRIDNKWFDSSNDLPAGHYAVIKVDSGLVGRPPRKAVPTIVAAGMNLDKANRTNAFTQALRDALGSYNAQTRRAKVDDTAAYTVDGVVMYPPMLSQNSKDRGVIDYANTYTQPKYNGVRSVLVLTNSGKPLVYSRNRNVYPDYDFVADELSRMTAHAKAKFPQCGTIYWDGENYTHGKALQLIAGDSRKSDIDKSADTFYLFDVFIPECPKLKFSERLQILNSLNDIAATLPHFRISPTFATHSEKEVKALYAKFKADGFEGAMLRMDEPYEYSYNAHHSDVLLKMKPVEDAEFRIVGYTKGTNGKSAGTLMMVCTTDTGIHFNVSLRDYSLSDAKAKYTEMSEVQANGKTKFENEYLGKPLIVYFEELSTTGVPLRAKSSLVVRTWD